MTSHTTGESGPGPQVGEGTHTHEESEDAQGLRREYDESQAAYTATKRPQFFRVPRWPAITVVVVFGLALAFVIGQAAGARTQSEANAAAIAAAEDQAAKNEVVLTAGVRCLYELLQIPLEDRVPIGESNGECERFLVAAETPPAPEP